MEEQIAAQTNQLAVHRRHHLLHDCRGGLRWPQRVPRFCGAGGAGGVAEGADSAEATGWGGIGREDAEETIIVTQEPL